MTRTEITVVKEKNPIRQTHKKGKFLPTWYKVNQPVPKQSRQF